MSNEMLELSLTEIAAAIRKRKISSREATRACLEQAQRVQPHINCLISIEAGDALKASRAADRALKRGARVGPSATLTSASPTGMSVRLLCRGTLRCRELWSWSPNQPELITPARFPRS